MSDGLRMLIVFGSLIAFVLLIVLIARSGGASGAPADAAKPATPDARSGATKKGS